MSKKNFMNEVGVTETLTDGVPVPTEEVSTEPAPNFMEAPIQETTPEPQPQPAVEIKVEQPAKKEEVHKRTVTL